MICFIHAAEAGKVHDTHAFEQFVHWSAYRTFFTGDEYLLGDAAYPISTRVITPYKGDHHRTAGNAKFNKKHSSVRGWCSLQ